MEQFEAVRLCAEGIGRTLGTTPEIVLRDSHKYLNQLWQSAHEEGSQAAIRQVAEG